MKLKVGQKLQTIRDEKKMNTSEFAELLSLSPSAYNRLERNETKVDFDEIIRFCEILKVPITEFLPEINSFHNHSNQGQGGIIYGNFIYNASNSEQTIVLESEVEKLKSENFHLQTQIELLKEQIELLKKIISEK